MKIFYHHPAPTKQKPVPTVMAVKQHRPWLCPSLLFTSIMMIIVGGLYLWNISVQSLRQEQQNCIEQYLQNNDSLPNNDQELQAKLEEVVSTAEELAMSLTKQQERQSQGQEYSNSESILDEEKIFNAKHSKL